MMGSRRKSSCHNMSGLTWRRYYALIWKDFVVHKRHYIWTMLEITIPVLVCAMAILSNSHQGKPKLEPERTFDPDDYERLYGDLNPARHTLLIAPNSSFTRALVEQIDDGAVKIELCQTEEELVEIIKREIPVSLDQVKRLLPDENANVTIGGVVIRSDELYLRSKQRQQRNHNVTRDAKPTRIDNRQVEQDRRKQSQYDSYFYEVTSKLDGQKIKIPIKLDMAIRAKDFRLGPEPYPKKFSLGPYLHSDHYQSTFFMASQIMLSRAYINLLIQYVNSSEREPSVDIALPTNDDLIGQRMPYPKYVAHKRLKETTLGTFVAGSQKQKPFVLTMDYCITVGFLVTAIFLAKRIVDEKKSRVRDMLRLVGISDWTYYGSHMTNTMFIMLIQCILITLLFTGHHDAPAQNIESSLMFAILLLYCFSAVMFVLALSTLFNSSTKAIIFTSLLWLGLPEIIDRIFKMNSGVIESNGFWPVDEQYHLLFCLLPNFGLRLMNRLLTECDIYGEFYDKKQLYGEYRAVWPNIANVLPLYKTITIAHIMGAMALSVPLYICLIYLVDSAGSATGGGLASLSANADQSYSKGGCLSSLYAIIIGVERLLVGILRAPFKLVHQLLVGPAYNTASSSSCNLTSNENISTSQHSDLKSGNLNVAYTNTNGSLDCLAKNEKGGQFMSNIELAKVAHIKPQILDCKAITEQHTSSVCSSEEGEGDHEQLNCDPRYFERAPAILHKGVCIRNLCKTYFTSSAKLRRIDAVRDVSLDMYYSQILVLLGHNGAGKTTLIDIISGHNQKTSGTIHIDGNDIDTHPAEARRRVGFCPQFDVLFERLTVEEHLYFYGIVKGARSELKTEIEELLRQSGLDVHRKKLSKALSGGYKRKLSLAIAMIAKSKVLILDEPTSGMDPESRRKVWDFLQLIRKDRLILMTTHHMEEADALGDRIAVMSLGQVKCCGSALFLKKVFNAGYHLRISKANNWNQIAFDELVGIKYKLQEKLENITPHELMYKFDVDETAQVLPKLFDDLELVKERVGIFGFGMTVSTMDDVFMKIGVHFKDVEAQEMQSKFEMANGIGHFGPTARSNLSKQQEAGSNGTIKLNGAQGFSPMNGTSRKERVEGKALFRQQVRAMLAKRYQHASKNWFQLLWILAISLMCVASIVILIDFVIFKEELTPEWSREMSLTGAGYGEKTTGIYQFAQIPSETADNFEALRDAAFPISNSTSTPSSTIASAASITTSTSVPPKTMSSTVVEATTNGEILTTANISTSIAIPLSTGSPNQVRRKRRRREATTIDSSSLMLNDSAQFLDRYWLNEARSSGMNELLTYTDVNTQMIDLLTKQFANFREKYIIGGEKAGKKYIAWYSGEATHSFPISMNIMLNSILKQFTDLIHDDKHPLKGSQINLSHIAMAQINTLIAFLPHLGRLINLVFLPFSLAFITSYFVIFPTHERVTKSKHLQLMTGVPTRTFWLSHFLFDIVLYLIYTVAVLSIYFVWDRIINDRKIYFANFEHSVALIALVTLFIFGALPLAYIFSFLAKKPTSAFSSFCVLTILTGTSTLTLVSLYELKYEQTASDSFKLAFTIFLWSARLIPSVSLLVGLQKLFALNTTRSICINISPEVLELLCRYINSPLVDDELRVLRPERCCKQVCENECYDQWPFFWSGWFGVNIELAMLVFDACLFWTILVLIESRSIRAKLLSMINGVCSSLLGSISSFCLMTRRSKKYCWQVPQPSSHQKTTARGHPSLPEDNKNYEDGYKQSAIRDLQREQQRVSQILATNCGQEYSLVVDNLTKIYQANKNKAVDQLSFCVDKREFFGLLGVNGAGKSSTFKMLTGELEPTSGSASIGPFNVANNRREYLQRIGYCPQQDALIDSLTGAEMLALFARLRGIPEHHVEAAVEDTLDKLGLVRIGHIESNNYSGGNKRRLSVGMALIGAPEVIFLDEPTSGVDPRSRRRLWSTLIEFQQQTRSSIVMTSHSMNECECLCDRIAIMVAGQFKVLGSIQYLRTKLSQGFSLVLKLNPDNLKSDDDLERMSENCRRYMEKAFTSSQIQLRDLHQTIIQYHIQPSSTLTWSSMLIALEKAKDELGLEDYQITSDASLESIFLSLAKEQQYQGPAAICS